MTQLLLKENCTVTITHSKTKDLKTECLRADIIIAAVGIPKLVKGDWVKKGAIVIDVGIFIVATNTGPLLRAQYLWSTLLWFFVHLFLLFAVVSISSKDTEGGV